MTHCVRWRSLILQGKTRFEGQTPSLNTQLQIAAATWQITMKSDSVFYQTTLVLVNSWHIWPVIA